MNAARARSMFARRAPGAYTGSRYARRAAHAGPSPRFARGAVCMCGCIRFPLTRGVPMR